MVELSHIDATTLHRLRTDLPYYARHVHRVKTKNQGIQPLIFTRAQMFFHNACESMLARRGYVRIIVVKGRQVKISTYVASRFDHKAQMEPATDVHILSHEAKSTANLFGKAILFNEERSKRFPSLAHGKLTDNRNELVYTNRSSYGVSTAGSENTGRGLTARLFHGSECAWWEGSQNIRAGILQAIALLPNTEAILETTANGMNWFYELVMESLDPESGSVWEVVFIPWFWETEYRVKLDPAKGLFVRSAEEQQIAETYGLDDEQLNFRRAKIVELGSVRMFKQEYPNSLAEAFQASGQPYYDSEKVAAALKRGEEDDIEPDHVGALILGVDPGRKGDRTVLTWRRGRVIEKVDVYRNMDSMRLTGIIAKELDYGDIDKVFIDNAIGYGTIDRLRERGYGQFVEGIDFGQSPTDDKFANKRAEMLCAIHDWLEDGEVVIKSDDIQQAAAIAADLAMIPEFKLTSNSRILFPSKDELRKEYKRSPDICDSLALTFAFPVRAKGYMQKISMTTNTKKGSSLSARNRVQVVAEDAGADKLNPFLTSDSTPAQRLQHRSIRRWGR